ncbi:MAG: TIGR00269 family protein [Nitrososphaeria archaeon]
MDVKPCSKCGRPSFYYRPYSGEYLCKGCFVTSIYDTTLETVRKYQMIKYGERVVVGVSGGKDSISLLYVLAKFFKGNEIIAVTLDEGIRGYREEGIEIASKMASSLNVKHVVYSYKQLFSYSIDEVQPLRGKLSSCTICGIFRRRGLDIAAKELGAQVVATAHNLDDVLQTYFILLTNGDVERLRTFNPAVEESQAFGIRKVHPFFRIYEKELAIFAMLKGFDFQTVTCPYMEQGIRSEIRSFLNGLEERHPGIKYQLLSTFMQISSEKHKAEGQLCRRCGWPSKGELCQVCRTIDYLNGAKYKLSREENV